MGLFRQYDLLGIVLAALALAASILTGFLGEFITSEIILGTLLFLWLAWLTIKVLMIEKKIEEDVKMSRPIEVSSSLPYEPFYHQLNKKPILISTRTKKVKLPATFLGWDTFTIVFWVKVNEDFFHTQNNRYLFSYVPDVRDSSDYPNSFFFGIKGGSGQWRFVIKGNDPKNATSIEFGSGDNLIGWKLVAVRWKKSSQLLDFSIDAGHAFREERIIQSDYWPRSVQNHQFHLGGWQDSWDGGLSSLIFYNFRVFVRCLSEPDLETLYGSEKKAMNSLRDGG